MSTWTDEELVEAFESCVLADEDFRHEEHVRVAWTYLSNLPPLEALQRFSTALKRFATHHGADGLYHETITWAYVLLIHERMAQGRAGESWQHFRVRNPDLMVFKGGALECYYRPETLRSELARRVFVLPDRGIRALSASEACGAGTTPGQEVRAAEPAAIP